MTSTVGLGTRRKANLALLALVPAAVLSGLFSNTIGTDWLVDPAMVHGLVSLAIAIVSPWKSSIIRRARERRGSSTWPASILLASIIVTLATGLAHSSDIARRIGPLTVMQVHIGCGLGALLLVFFHFRRYPVPIQRTDLGRRAFLSAAALAAAAGVVWVGWESLLRIAGTRGAGRRFTGSHERGSFVPKAMPVTSWLNDDVPRIEPEGWRVRIGATELSLAQLESFGLEELDAVLDCTSGWYSEQRWAGVRLDRLVPAGATSMRVISITGYGRRFPATDLHRLWLVTRAGGEPLTPGHGFPARIVAPDRRGFWWVKWVQAIEPSDVPAWLQLPFPAS